MTDVALAFQYGSPEAFSRAFKRFFGVSPSVFRRTRRFSELYPRLTVETEDGGISVSARKTMDVGCLFDELKRLGGSYVLCVDLIRFEAVNREFGRAAGDLVLAEAFARLEQLISEDMLLFRIGSDEFVIITGYAAPEDAVALAQSIVLRNDETTEAGGRRVPVRMRVGVSRLPEQPANFKGMLATMYEVMDLARGADGDVAVMNGLR